MKLTVTVTVDIPDAPTQERDIGPKVLSGEPSSLTLPSGWEVASSSVPITLNAPAVNVTELEQRVAALESRLKE